MDVLKVIFIIFEVVLLFNLLIFVHELGHFLAARWRGLKVERFAIWFGKPIWSKKIRGVEYALGWIPAGGYVSLPQMATMEAIEGKTEDKAEQLPPISPMDKIIVAFAGPLFSFGLAVFFAVIVWIVGKPISEADKTTTIGWADPSGPAWVAGLRPGDKILEIDGHPVKTFISAGEDSITWRIVTSEGTNIAVKYLRDNEEKIAHAVPYLHPNKWYERKALRKLLISPEQKATVYEVATNSPAALADLRRGDEIVAVNKEKVFSPLAVLNAETNAGSSPILLTVNRDGKQLEIPVAAEKPVRPPSSPPSIGVIAWMGNTNVTIDHPKPLAQVKASVSQIFSTLKTITSRNSDIGVQQLGGAVMIIRVYKNLFESENGWRLVLWFSVVMNVNLALLNLLPLPVLDGGHITLAAIEAVRRRPVNAKVLQFIQTGFAAVLIGFMIFIAFYDTGDWVRSARNDREEPIEFAPKPNQ